MNKLNDLIRLYLNEQIAIARNFPVEDVAKLAEAVWSTYERDGSVYVFANGGPAGTAEGFATDLKIHPFISAAKDKTMGARRLKVHCLNESTSAITAISNDLGYADVFVEQLKNYLRSPEQNQYDVVIGFSGSGNSENVLRAFRYAKKFGVTTACITGRGGGRAKDIVDICVLVPGTSQFPGQTDDNDNNFHIEDFQTSITHIVTGILKERIMAKYGKDNR